MKTKHFFLALMLTIVGTMQIQAYTVYYYNIRNLKFAVWSWADGVESQWSDWMTPVSGHIGWYQTTIRDNCNMVIFASFFTSAATPDWSGKKSQTADLTYDGENAYYVEGKGWQNGFGDNHIVASGTCGENLRWTLDDNGTLTISGTGDMTHYGYIDDTPWYQYYFHIKNVIINSGVTSIGGHAFSSCSSLTSITIPNSITSIGACAFNECSGLTSVTIPNSVTSIGESAFYNCKGLTSITIPNSVTSIGEGAFSGCSSLTSVTIPNSVTSIGEGAFSGCSSLTSVTIPNSVTSIGEVESGNTKYDSRDNCNAIIETATNALIIGCKKTIIPNNVTSIGDGAFSYCRSLTSITIPNSITSIGYGAFDSCSSLTSITIPNSVTSIGEQTFSGCSGLTSVTIPNSVTSIGREAFYGCSSLKNVVLGASLKIIEKGAFSNCSAIETITCFSQRPPTVKEKAFESLNYSTIVYVPADYLDTYKMHDAWGVYDVRPLGAKNTQTDNVQITPQDNTAEVVWPTVSGAATYELVIKDKQGNAVCTLTFNANGQLTLIAFGAPGREKAPEHTEAEGFSFTVTGLDEGTPYVLTIDVKDSAGKILQTFTQNFTTLGATSIDNVSAHINAPHAKKTIDNGIVYILLPDGRRYSLQGTEVK